MRLDFSSDALKIMMKTMEMNLSSFQKEIESRSGAVLVEFYSDSCTYWHILDPEMEAVKMAFAPELSIMKINADKSPELKKQFELKKYPTLILFRNGLPIWQNTGLILITQLLNELEEHLKLSPQN